MSGSLSMLRALITDFVTGGDQSVDRAWAIERYVAQFFPGTKLWEHLSGLLATYRPEGGEHLLDKAGLVRELRAVLSNWEEWTQGLT